MQKHKKVPIVLQMENVECGAACLGMVFAFHKKFIPLERLRIDCGVSRDGVNMKNMAITAAHYGLTPNVYKIEAEALSSQAVFPAIIHWNFNHFVVLVGFEGSKLIINDPACGTLKVEFEEFERSYTGIIMMLERSADFVADGTPKSVYKFLSNRLKRSRRLVLYIALTGLLLAILGIGTPLFARIFFDYVLPDDSSGWLTPLLAAMGGTACVLFLLEYLQSHFILKLQGKFAVTSSSAFMWHVLQLPMDFFAARFAGDISEKQRSNDEIAAIICTKILPVLISVVMIGIYLVILLYFNVTIALVGLAVAAGNIAAACFTTDLSTTMTAVRDEGKFSGIAISGIEMIETIKSSGAENGYFEKVMGYATKRDNTQYKIDKQGIRANIVPEILKSLLNIFVLVLGVYLILNRDFTIGILLAVQGFMVSFLQPVNDLVPLASAIKETRSHIERIDDVMNYQAEDAIDLEGEVAPHCEKLSGEITIEHLSFSYNPLIAGLVEDFNLELKKGDSIALVGASGSGKSTIAKLIAGLHMPQAGRILFDGKSKSEHDRIVFAHSLAIIEQDYTIFNDTITNNVTLWDDLVPGGDVLSACKDALIHQDIIRRTDGYDNELSFSGKNLSGGQCQRIDIARALVSNPSILILDEATSALDPATEKAVMDNIKRRGITTIIVAHRLSAIRDCDQILYLRNGVVTERGTHDELMEQGGLYAKLVSG